MSAATEAAETDDVNMLRCASCGIAGGDGDISLKTCTACHLVKYCGVKCQRDHWPKHKKECKKRAAELRDEILFKQPETSHLGDCPICCLPLSDDTQWAKNILMACCGKTICCGCYYANMKRERTGRLEHKCPFCRHPLPKSGEDPRIPYMKRVEANDPEAICHMGARKYKEGDVAGGLDYFSKAAELGDARAHFNLSQMYYDGLGVERDEKKQLYHLERAAIGGHSMARHNLGCMEERHGNMDRAIKHWIIAANLAYELSLEALQNAYRKGLVSKEDFTEALRGYQAAIEAAKSPQRKEGAEFNKFLATEYGWAG
jgi:hypothetical protein